jgi:glycosyltransferase involved in cell wall biosynthesis
MKILLATVYDYPHAGGLSTHVSTLQVGLEALGHQVDVLSFSDVPRWQQVLLAKGPSWVLNKFSKGSGIVWSHRMREWMLHELLRGAKKKGYDVVNAQDPFATLAALRAGYPTVSTVHGYMTFESISKGSMVAGSHAAAAMTQVEVEAYQQTGAVVTVDTRLKEYVEALSGVNGTAIRNFIDVDGFRPEQAQKAALREVHGIAATDEVLFCPRRLTKKNGVIYPALALVEVLRQRPATHLIYAGSGEALGDIRQIVADHKMEQRVTLLGAIPHDQVKAYYAMADVVLVPSVHSAGVEEATSISALEAMGCGAPLIACAVGGLKEIVEDGVDGVLVEEKNVPALAEAIVDLLAHPEKGAKLAQAARAKIEAEYSHLAAAKHYVSIYDTVRVHP